MSKSILTIGLKLASSVTTHESFRSTVSLLDWDIIVFRPQISSFWGIYDEHYQGKPCLNDHLSFKLKESCEHWRREIKQALDNGKTIIVYLPEVEEVYIATGEVRHSGTGRNQQTTRMVVSYTNYAALPVQLGAINATGSAMKLAPQGAEVLAPYWAEFSSFSEYKVLLSSGEVRGIITTKNGDKPVATIIRSKTSSGALVLLPDVDFESDTFFETQGESRVWTPIAKQFSAKFVSSIIALDKVLRASADITPEPEWASNQAFVLGPERSLRSALLEAERKVEEAQHNKEAIESQLSSAGQMRALLYEKGKPLEMAIVEALKTLGFSAAPYRDSQSEFDVVFQGPEGRLLGEAEGKDNKAVNVDKLRQLAMNIHEDLQRDEVTHPAKPVLFGNGFRLSSPVGREIQFTEKCVTAAQASSTALVATTELFRVVQHLAEQPDEAFATLCRQSILSGVGIIALPEVPSCSQRVTEAVEPSA